MAMVHETSKPTMSRLSATLTGMRQREELTTVEDGTVLYEQVQVNDNGYEAIRPVILLGTGKDAVTEALLDQYGSAYSMAVTHTTG
jgi:hypothetical protein